jgi:hypothetical protein
MITAITEIVVRTATTMYAVGKEFSERKEEYSKLC